MDIVIFLTILFFIFIAIVKIISLLQNRRIGSSDEAGRILKPSKRKKEQEQAKDITQEIGEEGENILYNYLTSIKDKGYILSNLYIPRRNGATSEIDILYINKEGVHVFESKNYTGWIFGNERNRFWTRMSLNNFKSEKLSFYNPARQNRNHIKYLKDFLKTVNITYFSYLVFNDSATFKNVTLSSDIHELCHYKEVVGIVKRKQAEKGNALSQDRMDIIYNKLFALKGSCEKEESKKEAHILHIEEIKKRFDEKPKAELCPICGGKLKLRRVSKGKNKGKEFLGCSRYPECRYIHK